VLDPQDLMARLAALVRGPGGGGTSSGEASRPAQSTRSPFRLAVQVSAPE